MFITRFSLLAVFVYLLSLLMVACRSVSIETVSLSEVLCPSLHPTVLNHEDAAHIRRVANMKRRYRLHNRCGGKVHFSGMKLRASDRSSELGDLMVEAVTFKDQCRIKIKSASSNAYLCFTNKGRLVGRYAFKPEYCTFKELIDEHRYTQLVQNHSNGATWYVGFKKNGKPLRGSASPSKKHRCFQFQKLLIDADGQHVAGENSPSHERLEEAVRSLDVKAVKPNNLRHQQHKQHSDHGKGRHGRAAVALKPGR